MKNMTNVVAILVAAAVALIPTAFITNIWYAEEGVISLLLCVEVLIVLAIMSFFALMVYAMLWMVLPTSSKQN